MRSGRALNVILPAVGGGLYKIPDQAVFFREGLSGVMTFSPMVSWDGDIVMHLFSESRWKSVREGVERLSSRCGESRRIQRVVLGCAERVKIDKGGYFSIPRGFHEYIGSSNDFAVVLNEQALVFVDIKYASS